jgi:hypothetical protein
MMGFDCIIALKSSGLFVSAFIIALFISGCTAQHSHTMSSQHGAWAPVHANSWRRQTPGPCKRNDIRSSTLRSRTRTGKRLDRGGAAVLGTACDALLSKDFILLKNLHHDGCRTDRERTWYWQQRLCALSPCARRADLRYLHRGMGVHDMNKLGL